MGAKASNLLASFDDVPFEEVLVLESTTIDLNMGILIIIGKCKAHVII
jgi:hypothetical protein